jgi:hypothetical protein
MPLSYQLTDAEKIREQEIAARQGKLSEATRYMQEQLDGARRVITNLESGLRSIELERRQLMDEYSSLHRWDRPLTCPVPNCGVDHREYEFCRP